MRGYWVSISIWLCHNERWCENLWHNLSGYKQEGDKCSKQGLRRSPKQGARPTVTWHVQGVDKLSPPCNTDRHTAFAWGRVEGGGGTTAL